MRIEENKSTINWYIVLSVLSVIPPLGLMMILTYWHKSGKYSPISVLYFLSGLIYSLFIFLQLYKLW